MNLLKLLIAIGLVLFVHNLEAKVKTVQEWDNVFRTMTTEQKTQIVDTFLKARIYNFSYSLAAINLKESYGGKFKYNVNSTYSIDVGAFMINTKEYLRRTNQKVTKWNVARAMEDLNDYNTNFLMAAEILGNCYKEANGNWRLAYQYYNGWKSGSKASKEYSQDIVNIITMLKKYLRNVPTHP